jgi:hypothetical protein
MGFGPFQRLQLRKPGYLGFTSPDTFRLQGFAPSCRFTSSATFRPCFMPVTLLGFPFRASSPHRAFGPSRSRYLHDVSPRIWHARVASSALGSELPRLQGLTLCEDSSPSVGGVNRPPAAAALLVFSWPLGNSPLWWPAHSREPFPS